MPAGLHGRAPGESREARVRFPVPRKRDSSATCLAPDCRAASLEFYGECRWDYIGNQRIRIPPDQPQGRLRILINPCRHIEFVAAEVTRLTLGPTAAEVVKLKPPNVGCYGKLIFVTNAGGTTSLKRARFRVRIRVAPTDGAIAQR